MRIAFQSKPEDKARFFVRISEFSFAAYPVQISKVFRAIPAAPISEISSRHSRRREISARIYAGLNPDVDEITADHAA
jgi:site-specific recombinase